MAQSVTAGANPFGTVDGFGNALNNQITGNARFQTGSMRQWSFQVGYLPPQNGGSNVGR